MNIQDKNFLSEYCEFEKQVNQLALFYLLKYFQSMSIDISLGIYEKSQLIQKLGLQEKYYKFLSYALYALVEANYIVISNGKINFSIKFNLKENLDSLESLLRSTYPNLLEILNFVKHCANHFEQVLSGVMLGVSVVYPAGNVNFVRPVADLIDKIYGIEYQCDCLKSVFRGLREKDNISVLEVGAGVGLITWKLLPELAPDSVSYTFTDISRHFIVNAKKTATVKQIDFMDFRQLDISRSPKNQGYEENSFDFILALNVIHATPNILETLCHLKYVLRPGGEVFIVENVRQPVWINLAWGLLDSWWLFNDASRVLLPIVDANTWRSLLTQAGFSNIRTFTKPNENGCSFSFVGLLGQLI